MAGPLRPRWVMRIFSRKLAGRCAVGASAWLAGAVLEPAVAMTSAERPERSHQRAVSSGVKTRGTSAGRQGTMARPNWAARS